MARAVRSGNKDAHERAEMRLLRKMESLHGGKPMARKPHESKAEERRAGRKGARKEPEKAKAKGGRDSHKGLERAAEAKHGGKREGHMHHHHHHHHHHGAK